MEAITYQSSAYPTLSQFVEITASDYVKLRVIMTKRNELEKFIKWQKGKYFRLSGHHIEMEVATKFNASGYRTNEVY